MSQHKLETVKVWDIGIRVFHWALFAAFVIAYLTSGYETIVHIYSGYLIAGLVVFRLVWGLLGTQYARFNNFIYSPAVVFAYISRVITRQPTRRYVGHNPAGGWMVLALLLCLATVSVSGLKLYALVENSGPFAAIDFEPGLVGVAHTDVDEIYQWSEEAEEAEELWEEIHESSTNLALLLIILHIGGVIISSKMHGENLVRAMLTGMKKR